MESLTLAPDVTIYFGIFISQLTDVLTDMIMHSNHLLLLTLVKDDHCLTLMPLFGMSFK